MNQLLFELADYSGSYCWLVQFELAALFLVSARAAFAQRARRSGAALGLFALFFAALAAQYAVDPGRPILTLGLIQPGTPMCRLAQTGISHSTRRLSEPSFWLFILILSAQLPYSSRRKQWYRAIWCFTVLGLIEALAVSPAFQEAAAQGSLRLILVLADALLTQLFFIFCLRGLGAKEPSSGGGTAELAAFAQRWVMTVAACTALIVLADSSLVRRSPPIVAAHYYSWFPENWRGGYSGRLERPAVQPLLGEYASDDPNVLKQQIGWFNRAGINVLIFDWWPRRKEIRRRVRTNAKALAKTDLRFCLLYETIDIKEPQDPPAVGEAPNVVVLNEPRLERLKRHWELIAREYMSSPQYLRLYGRPVLFVYVSRHLVGDVRAALAAARKHVFEQTGVDLFLIGDEAFENVLDYSSRSGVFLRGRLSMNWRRINAFDGLTSYNPYDPQAINDPNVAQRVNKVLSLADEVYRKYAAAATAAGELFVPTALPGYDDRGLRPNEGHEALPRDFDLDGFERSFFTEALKRMVAPHVTPQLPFFTVTSWNEWNEGTQIEPAVHNEAGEQSAPANISSSYGPYHFRHLHELRSFRDTELSKHPR